MSKKAATAKLGSLLGAAALVGGLSLVGSTPAAAEVSPTHQWITSLTGSNAGAAGLATFGTSGVTATLSPRGGGCDTTRPNQVSNATLTSFNSQAYWSPQAPGSAVGALNCVTANTTVNERLVGLNRTIASPVLHVNNLDASTLRLRASSIGDGPIRIDPLKQNVSGSVVDGNTIVPGNPSGSAGCNDTPPGPGVNNSTCGSYRLSQGDGGPIRSLRFTNIGGPASNDGWYWSMSFPMMSLTKEFGDGAVRVGESTDLTFAIANTDPDDDMDVTGLSFADNLPAGLTLASESFTDNGHCGTPTARGLAAGTGTVDLSTIVVDAGSTCRITVRVVADAPGTYRNTDANIVTTIANLVPDADATLRVDDAGMTLAKSSVLAEDADGDGLGDVGDVLRYTFAVANTGTLDLADVSIRDDRVSAVTPEQQDVPAGGTRTFTADYAITQDDVDAGRIENVATATGVDPDGGTVTTAPAGDIFEPADRDPRLTLDKGASLVDEDDDGVADVGETVTYTFDVENTGNVTMTGVTVDDDRVTSILPGPVSLAPGASQRFTASYLVTPTDILAGVVHNEATATGTSPLGGYTSPPDVVDTATAEAEPGLTVAKSSEITTDGDGDGRGDVDDVVTYTFRVTNTGNTSLSDVSVADPMLGRGAIAPASVDLGVGATADFTASYRIVQDDLDRGSLRNVATATGSFTHPEHPGSPQVVTSPPGRTSTPLEPRQPELRTEKRAALVDGDGNGSADEGERIVYSFTVVNTGNVTLRDVVVSDPMLEGLLPEAIAVLGPGEQYVATAEPYIVTARDADGTDIVNVARATGTAPDGAAVSSVEASVATPSTDNDDAGAGAQGGGSEQSDAGGRSPDDRGQDGAATVLPDTGSPLSWAALALAVLAVGTGVTLVRGRPRRRAHDVAAERVLR